VRAELPTTAMAPSFSQSSSSVFFSYFFLVVWGKRTIESYFNKTTYKKQNDLKKKKQFFNLEDSVNFLYTQWGTPTTIDDDSKLLFEFLFFFPPHKTYATKWKQKRKEIELDKRNKSIDFVPGISTFYFLPSFLPLGNGIFPIFGCLCRWNFM
jgi:hypothetical protein